MSITENYKKIKENIPENVKLVAVSKTKPIENILELYNANCLIFGENKVQELCAKQEQLPKDIEWHHIGHLQTNKVKYIAKFVYLIHAVDSFKLLKVINKEAKKNNRTINVLLQMHIAQEQSKFGMTASEIETILQSEELKLLKNIKIVGLMGMATNTDDTSLVRNEFKSLKNFFTLFKEKYFNSDVDFKEISMGMSSDYLIAIEEGATIVRVGSSIFGQRDYTKQTL